MTDPLDDLGPEETHDLPDGLEWARIYWIRGKAPRGAKFMNDETDPPCNGWQHAFILHGEKLSTIFCPYSMTAFQVTNHGAEMTGRQSDAAFRREYVVNLMLKNWDEMQALGYTRDYDTCALVLKKLGEKVPKQIMTGGGEDTRRKGGKEVCAELLKPVKRSSKRGKFLAWFLETDGTRSVREAMAEFSMTRSNALSYLYMLQKDHGIGYELVGDMVTLTLPDCESPFDEIPAPVEDDDDDWLK